MADNTSQAGTDTIATDDVTTLNGAASSGVKVQRVKVAFGDDGTARDASSTYPLPVTEAPRATRIGLVHSGRLTVGASADAATVARVWLVNPVSSGIVIEIRRVSFLTAPTAATVFASSPRVTLERVTFTGSPSGASLTPAQRDSTDASLLGSARTASTGMTLVAGAVVHAFSVTPVLTAVGHSAPAIQEWTPDVAERLVLRPGQGMAVRQADAGTASDTRIFHLSVAWGEYV